MQCVFFEAGSASLGAFPKLQARLLTSSCLSVHTEHPGSHWAVCHEIWYLWNFSDKNKAHFTCRPIYIFLSYLAHFFLQWKIFQEKVEGKIKTHILFPVSFFESRTVYEKMWKNIVECHRPQTTIWCMCIACWISKATNTLSLFNNLCFSTATMVARTCLNMLYVYCLSC